jgi:hypothetical protein
MAPDPAVTGSSGGDARSKGGGGEVVGASHRCPRLGRSDPFMVTVFSHGDHWDVCYL